jgi:hypothetical protein
VGVSVISVEGRALSLPLDNDTPSATASTTAARVLTMQPRLIGEVPLRAAPPQQCKESDAR